MNITQLSRNADQLVRRYEYDDGAQLAVDFGGEFADATIDVVDGTAIIVYGDEQLELELPAGVNEAHTFMKNGVLTIDLEDAI